MHSELTVLISAFVTMFVVIDPIGTAAYFASISGPMTQQQRISTAAKACFVSLLIVPVFVWQGADLLEALHIHLPSFQIAGGLFLLLIAIKMVLTADSDDHVIVGKDISVFPLAIPFIAGPDTLAAALLLVTNDEHIGHVWPILGGFAAVLVISFLLLAVAGQMARLLGPSILSAVNKIIGMLLGAYSVEYIVDGFTAAMAIHQ